MSSSTSPVEEGSPGRRYQGATSNERAARRRSLLLEAGVELFGTVGIAETRVRDVCKVSGVTERYFYESFSNSDEFVIAVVDLVMGTVAHQVQAEAGAVAPGRDRVRRALEALVDLLDRDPRLGRIMYIETVGNGPELAARRHAMIEQGAGLLGAWLNPPRKARRSRTGADPQLVPFVLSGAVIEVLVAWLEKRAPVTKNAIVDALVSLYDWAVPTPADGGRGN